MTEQPPPVQPTNRYVVWILAGFFILVVIPLLAIFGFGVVAVIFNFVSHAITTIIVVIARLFGFKSGSVESWDLAAPVARAWFF